MKIIALRDVELCFSKPEFRRNAEDILRSASVLQSVFLARSNPDGSGFISVQKVPSETVDDISRRLSTFNKEHTSLTEAREDKWFGGDPDGVRKNSPFPITCILHAADMVRIEDDKDNRNAPSPA
ncbi:MAG: hypothetical protein ACLFP8_02230 [Alphaproteobacteria bacterium]